MKDETFHELLGSANEALEHVQSKRNLRAATLPRLPRLLNARRQARADGTPRLHKPCAQPQVIERVRRNATASTRGRHSRRRRQQAVAS